MKNQKKYFKKKGLKASQKEVLFDVEHKVLKVYEEKKKQIKAGSQTTKGAENVIAVTGSRGMGKTTILNRFAVGFSKTQEFVPTAVIDASTVDENTGILATCIQKMWDAFLEKLEENPVGLNQSSSLTQSLTDGFNICFRSALSLGHSYREMAREMAMNPGQYEKIIHDRVSQQKNVRENFEDFIGALGQNIVGKSKKTHPKFVVFLDDLDLAKRDLVLSWARALVNDYKIDQVLWVLSFDRNRMISMLSNPKPEERNKKDLITGTHLLAKLVPTHLQFPLSAWTKEEQLEFQPFETTKEKPLKKLIKTAEKNHIIPLLPNNPRGLEGIYKWLEQHLASGTRYLSDQAILLKLAEVNNLTAMINLFGNIPPHQWITSLRWESDTLTKADWASVVQAAKTDEPIWGLPLPDKLDRRLKDFGAESFTEALCDTGLKGGAIQPFQCLNRLPFTSTRLKKSFSRISFPEADIREFFEDYPKTNGFVLFWGSWSGPDDSGMWEFKLGPDAFWSGLLELRNPLPNALIKELFLYEKDFEAQVLKITEEVRETLMDEREIKLLPRNFRALLVLVDNLMKAPWKELESKRTLWTPVTYTQCSAAFQLAALANAIWSDKDILKAILKHKDQPTASENGIEGDGGVEKKPPLFYFPKEPFSVISNLSELEIDQAYADLVEVLKNLEFDIVKSELKKQPLLIQTRKEIYKMLKKLLKLPVVTELRLKKE